MRIAVTLDPDVAAELQVLMLERGTTFMEAINQTLRRGLGQRRKALSYVAPTHDLGLRPGVDLTKALRPGSELEDWTSMRAGRSGPSASFEKPLLFIQSMGLRWQQPSPRGGRA